MVISLTGARRAIDARWQSIQPQAKATDQEEAAATEQAEGQAGKEDSACGVTP
jgi:hypothetical protein